MDIKKQLKSTQPLIREETRIPDVSGMDGLISLMEQVADNKESFHFDQFLALLIRMHPFVGVKDVVRMVPAFEQAYRVLTNQVEEVGELDILAAAFLMEYIEILFTEFGYQVPELRLFYVQTLYSEGKSKSKKVRQPHREYKGYWELTKWAIGLLKDKVSLPVLSTPTHLPAWIDPVVLVARLLEYQARGIKPDILDFQIAVSRVALDRTKEALRLAEKELTGEYRELFLFLFMPDARPKGPFTLQAMWMTAALVKSPDTVYEELAAFPYSTVDRAYLTGDIPCGVFVFEKPFGKVDRILQLVPPVSRNVAIQKRFGGYALYMTYRFCTRTPLLVETFWKITPREKDLKRLLLLSPNAPQVILALLIRDRVRDSYWNDEELSRLCLVALDTLLELDYPWGRMSNTFLALCLLSVSKTVRKEAVVLWAQQVKNGEMDSEAVGHILGEVEAHEWAPVSRLANLAAEEMMNIKPLYNKELEKMLIALLSHLPESPVKDLKRLLEVFADLQAVNQSKVTDKVLLALLRVWSENTKLSETIEKINIMKN